MVVTAAPIQANKISVNGRSSAGVLRWRATLSANSTGAITRIRTSATTRYEPLTGSFRLRFETNPPTMTTTYAPPSTHRSLRHTGSVSIVDGSSSTWCVVNRPESSWPRSCRPGVDLLRRCLEVGRGQDEVVKFSSDVEDPDTFGLPGIDVLAMRFPATLIRARELLLSQVEKSWSAGTDHSKSTEGGGGTGHRAPL